MIKKWIRNCIFYFINDQLSERLQLMYETLSSSSNLVEENINNRIKILSNSMDKRLEYKINRNDLNVSRLETLSDFLKATDDRIANVKVELVAFVLEAINDNEDIAFEVIRDFVKEEIIRCLNKRDEEIVPNISHLSLTNDNLKVKDKKESVYFSVFPTEEVDFFLVTTKLSDNQLKSGDKVYNPHTQETMILSSKNCNDKGNIVSLTLKRGTEGSREKPIQSFHRLLIL